jgi:hypothetical protein
MSDVLTISYSDGASYKSLGTSGIRTWQSVLDFQQGQAFVFASLLPDSLRDFTSILYSVVTEATSRAVKWPELLSWPLTFIHKQR